MSKLGVQLLDVRQRIIRTEPICSLKIKQGFLHLISEEVYLVGIKSLKKKFVMHIFLFLTCPK